MADERLNEFLEAYDVHRVMEQENFYASRVREYVAADRQAGGVAELLLFLAGVCGVFATAWPAYALWLGVGAAALAAGATVLHGWAELIGFSKNAEIFRIALDRVASERPCRPKGPDVQDEKARAYVAQMEDILLSEVRSWGKEWGRTDDEPPSPE